MHRGNLLVWLAMASVAAGTAGCQRKSPEPVGSPAAAVATAAPPTTTDPAKFLTQPLVTHIYTADPSAHVFDGRIYIYPSHDIEAGIAPDRAGSHFAMRDYHVLSMETPDGEVTDHGIGLDIRDVPWAGRQLWAPDAAQKGGKYYLYFPAKDKQDIFRIGVAVADSPIGPFVAQPEPIAGTYSIDPAVFQDDDGQYYLIVGGIRGGQLQHWTRGSYQAEEDYPADDQPALMPRMARLSDDMLSIEGDLKDVVIQDESGRPLLAGDNARRFFEAPWLHKHDGTYYLTWSTGDTHYIVYATSASPSGPFTYRGKVLEPVQGWTTHQSIVEFQGRPYLFYHDTQLSGKTHLRNIKMVELHYNADGSIQTIDPMKQ